MYILAPKIIGLMIVAMLASLGTVLTSVYRVLGHSPDSIKLILMICSLISWCFASAALSTYSVCETRFANIAREATFSTGWIVALMAILFQLIIFIISFILCTYGDDINQFNALFTGSLSRGGTLELSPTSAVVIS
jgi:hypothetical protein